MALTDKLTAIANAIRAKTGGTATMTLAEMPTEIASIPSGGITPSGSITLTEERTYDVTEKAQAVVDFSSTRADLAEAITAKGVDTLPTASFDTIATNIGLIGGGDDNPFWEYVGEYVVPADTGLVGIFDWIRNNIVPLTTKYIFYVQKTKQTDTTQWQLVNVFGRALGGNVSAFGIALEKDTFNLFSANSSSKIYAYTGEVYKIYQYKDSWLDT